MTALAETLGMTVAFAVKVPDTVLKTTAFAVRLPV